MYAKYTVVLKDIMENEDSKVKLNAALSTYPLYDIENKELNILNIPSREELNRRLLNHYKYREIGFETVGRFLDELEIAMCEIMPYYNEMYKTVEIIGSVDNIFDNVDVTHTFKETRTGTATSEDTVTRTGSSSNEASTTTTGSGTASTTNEGSNTINSNDSSQTSSTVNNNSKNVHSDTPQSQLSITGANIDSVSYADSVQWNKNSGTDTANTTGESTSTTNSNSESNSNSSTNSSSESTGSQSSNDKTEGSGTKTNNETIEHSLTRKGNQGVNTYAHDILEFRQTVIDVTNQIINDNRIAELFMMVY